MTNGPKAVAFDIIETVFSLEPLRQGFVSLGLPPGALETWLGAGLRDAFALAATDRFAPFRSVLEGALDEVASHHDLAPSAKEKAQVLDRMKELPAHPDAEQAFQAIAAAGMRILALSNGAASATDALLKRAGLDRYVERVISVEEVELAKPRREVYLHAASLADVQPGELALVAAHAWDVHGARAAGLIGAFVARGKAFPASMLQPDVVGQSLAEVARKLVKPGGVL
jgi:2-haloacid dehalogenase